MGLSAIIVTYNSERTICQCIKSIKESDKNTEIIVVDSNSSDSTLKLVAPLADQVIALKENVGYAKGNNLGVEKAGGKYLLILNPDIVIEKNTIPTLLEECKPQTIISPKVLLKDGKINYFGADINFLGFGTIRHFGEEDRIKVDREETTGITGSCFMTRKKDYLRFDGDYFMYNDDTDYSIRALQKDDRIIVTNKTFVTHLRDMEDLWLNSFKYYYDERNRLVTVIKDLPWKNFMGVLLFEPIMIIHALLTFQMIERANIYCYIVNNFKSIINKREAKGLNLGYNMNIEKFIPLPFAGVISFIVNLYSYVIHRLFFH